MAKILKEILNYFLFALCLLSAHLLGIEFYFQPEHVATFWPPVGLLAGAYILARTRKQFILLTLIALACQLVTDVLMLKNSIAVWLAYAFLNIVEPALVAIAIRLLPGSQKDYLSLNNILKLSLLGGVVSAAGVALLGAALVVQLYPGTEYWHVWQIWWFADALGLILVTPAVLAMVQCFRQGRAMFTPRVLLESLGALGALGLVLFLMFRNHQETGHSLLDFPYMVLPIFIWGALRFRSGILAILLLVNALAMVALTDAGHGPFISPGHSVFESVLDVQTFLALTNLTILMLATMVEERRKNERELEQTVKERTAELVQARDRAEQASLAKSVFLANMSHEIRTPMNSVLGFAEILMDKLQDSEQRKYLGNIQTGGRMLLKLVNDILDLSRIEAGKLKIDYSPVNLRELCREIQTVFRNGFEQKELGFRLHIDENLPPYLLLDENRVRQILLNLVGNALKFTERGFVKLSVRPVGQGLELAVSDSGPGIPASMQQEIFENFSRLHETRMASKEGVGLGLSICRRLANLMDGEIRLAGQEGQGSVFTLVLFQIQEATAPPRRIPSIPAKGPHRLRPALILLVDDIESNRDVVRGFLAQEPLRILEAENGKQALDILAHESPDLILLDMLMPEMGGVETVLHLEHNEAWRKIPVIALTAMAMEGDRSIVPEACEEYLTKPLSRAGLLEAMAGYLPARAPDAVAGESAAMLAQALENESLRLVLKQHLQESQTLLDTLATEQVGQVELFAKGLRNLGESSHNHNLSRWSDTLHTAAANSNVSRMKVLLLEFQEALNQAP